LKYLEKRLKVGIVLEDLKGGKDDEDEEQQRDEMGCFM
jgi:hypothetical protein